MAIKDTRELHRTPQQMRQDRFDDLVNDLIIEFTVGGDRFDVSDIDMQIQAYGFDREAMYVRLREEAEKINAESVGKGLGEILPEVLFIKMAEYWLFSELDNRYEPVQREDGKWNIQTRSSHELLSPDMWFDSVSSIDKGKFRVTRDEGWESNFLLSNGKLMSPVWFDRCMDFYEGYVVVSKDDREWYVDRTNKSLTGDVTFKECRSFNNGAGVITNEEGKKQIIDCKGELSSRSFVEIGSFIGESAMAREKDGKLYLVDKKGNHLNGVGLDKLYVTALPSVSLVAKRIKGEKRYNLMHVNGEILLSGWPRKLKVESDSYGGIRSYRKSMYVTVDDTYSMTVYKSGKLEMSPELKDHLSMQPKVKSSSLNQEKKNRSNLKF